MGGALNTAASSQPTHVALVGTGTPVLHHEIVAIAQQVEALLGIKAVYDQDTYCTLPPRQRADILLKHISNPHCHILWSVRGGEGSADLIPFLEARAHHILLQPKKIMIGFSDFTPLLVYFTQKMQWHCIHGIGALQAAHKTVDRCSIEKTVQLLTQNTSDNVLPLTPLNRCAQNHAKCSGSLVGGNLSLLAISNNEPWQLDFKNKIALIEEVNEPAYKVRRLLKHFARIGFFDGANALIFAGFDFTKPHEYPKNATENIWQALTDFAYDAPLPVFYCKDIGHGRVNHPIPFYKNATISTKPRCRIIF